MYFRKGNNLTLNGVRAIAFNGAGEYFKINITTSRNYTDLNFILFGRMGICAYTITGASGGNTFYKVHKEVLSYREDYTLDRVYPISLSTNKDIASIDCNLTAYDVIIIIGICSNTGDSNTFVKENYEE